MPTNDKKITVKDRERNTATSKLNLILLFWVNDKGANMMSESAQTRLNNIKKMNWYDPIVCKIHSIPIKSIDQIIEITEKYIQKYGGKDKIETREIGIFSHSGEDGPICYREPVIICPLDDRQRQMSLEGWEKIDFNWKKQDAICVFYGCRSGLNLQDNIGHKCFAQNISVLSNFNNVEVWGQGSSSFPSFYPDYRVTTLLRSLKTGFSIVGNCQTYMVGGGNGEGNDALFPKKTSVNSVHRLTEKELKEYPKAKVMNSFKNGKEINSTHQGVFNDHRK